LVDGNSVQPAGRRSEFFAGARLSLPLVIGAIPFGIIFGALAVTSGLTPAAALGMSLFVFAGSSQFIAASLVAQNTSIGLIVLTTLIVNLRHALYSTTLAPSLRHLSQRWLLPLGFWLTDETFLVTAAHYERKAAAPYKHWFQLGSSIFMYVNWQICTLAGILAGQTLPDPGSWGLDFAMVVTFLGMLVPQARNKPVFTAILISGGVALLTYNLPNQIGLFLAALAGIVGGILSENIWRVE